MIIRRRKTRDFVQLENRLVRDQALSLDEHGMLHYLLSLPDDWEVSRANCAKFWGIGREKAARIFRSLRRRGWAQVERIHGEDGTFLGVRWIITDEPGAPVEDEALDADADDEADEIEAAQNSASDESSAEKPAADNDGAEAAAGHDTAQPQHGSTVVRPNHDTGNPHHGVYIDSKKTESYENRDSQTPAGAPKNGIGENVLRIPEPTFSMLVKAWPPDNVLSRVAAEAAWQRHSKQARQRAIDTAPRYLDDCRANSRKVCDLTTFLREARWERFAAALPLGKTASYFTVKPTMPQWHRWREYRIATGESVAWMDECGRRGNGFTVPAEWPPALPPREGESPPTADDETLMNDEDYAHFQG